MMQEIENFYNDGFGWICKRCEKAVVRENHNQSENLPRVWREGEAETKQPKLAAPVAKWLDHARTTLVCARCQTMEAVDKV